MAQDIRQNNLFAAEDWQTAYKAFTNVNFKAYDFNTIRQSMITYIRENYPEKFNDYIESSEFIAIIELLAYLSQNLAFRVDLNTRENFLSTAESRESVLRLAKMLGYAPKRNTASAGIMKVTAVQTTQDVTDSFGRSIANERVNFDDASESESYDKFISIMNASLSTYNKFTKPVAKEIIGGISSELYQVNSIPGTNVTFPFSLTLNGTGVPYEMVSAEFSESKAFKEKAPDPDAPFQLIYRNDGRGLSGSNTGFFLMFKQGTLEYQDAIFDKPIKNNQVSIDQTMINESDVWVQEINNAGEVLNQWNKVPNLIGQTLFYNNLALDNKRVYAVDSGFEDNVIVKFADGNFGAIPVGTFRMWYRSSAGTYQTINPTDAVDKQINIPYTDANGNNQVLTLFCSLQYTVSNGTPAESIQSIKQRAPQVYQSQDRMVSAQDYNVYPYAVNNNILKLKAINRTHSGHSRFIDINDPTGKYQSVTVYGEDGLLYKEDAKDVNIINIDGSTVLSEVVESLITSKLSNSHLKNFIYEDYRNIHLADDSLIFDLTRNYSVIKWVTQPNRATSTTGYLTIDTGGTPTVLKNNQVGDVYRQIQENARIKFQSPTDSSKYKWVVIKDIQNNGGLITSSSAGKGPITMSTSLENGWRATELVVSVQPNLIENITTAITTEISSKRDFGLGYNPNPSGASQTHFFVINNSILQKDAEYSADLSTGACWIAKFEYEEGSSDDDYSFKMTTRGKKLLFESFEDVQFIDADENYTVDPATGNVKKDVIELLDNNSKPSIEETYYWVDTNADGVGDAWQLKDTNNYYTPTGNSPEIVLKNRDVRANELSIKMISNFGLLQGGDANVSVSDTYSGNEFISPITVEMSVNSQTNSNGQAVVKPNSGKITNLPNSVEIPLSKFASNVQGGANSNIAYVVVDSTGTNTYRGNVSTTSLQRANAQIQGSVDVTSNTTIKVNEFDSKRTLGLGNQDVLKVKYSDTRERLDENIRFDISDKFTYADGYIDYRKIEVLPVDTDFDGVPDEPLAFSRFVDPDDLVFFENQKDLQGNDFIRPIKTGILDYRAETSAIVDFLNENLAPGSNVLDQTDFTQFTLILVPTKTFAQTYLTNNKAKLHGKKVYVADTKELFDLQIEFTDSTNVILTDSQSYTVKNGRSFTQNTNTTYRPVSFKWEHVAPSDIRIDPSISNIVEMFVLTRTYYSEVLKYKNSTELGKTFPLGPTSETLSQNFSDLEKYKSISDQIIYRSGKFKVLFGTEALPELQATFKAIKLPSVTISDNEIKSRVKQAIDQFFNIQNWDFGESFYFTELTAYVHTQTNDVLGSLVIVPKDPSRRFGDLFVVRCEPDEIFMSTATVSDIKIVSDFNQETLQQIGSAVQGATAGATADNGPYAINGYYPLYATADAASEAGDGTSHSHTFFGQTFYMPNGVTYYHGTYNVSNDGLNSSNTGGTSTSSGGSSGSSGSSGSGGY